MLMNAEAKLLAVVDEAVMKLKQVAHVRATLRRGHSYMKILRDRGEPNRRDTLTQW